MGADILSRQGPRPGEWMLHPEVVKQIWRVFGQAQVDLFAIQCPWEIALPTLPLTVLQGAGVSSEHFSQSLPPRNVAELRGSPPFRGSLEQLEQLEQPSPPGPPLQGTELAALSTPEASLERLVPLVDYLAAWKLLPTGSGGPVCDSRNIALSPLVLSDSSSSTGAGCHGTSVNFINEDDDEKYSLMNLFSVTKMRR